MHLSSAIWKPVHPHLSHCRRNHSQTCTFDIITIQLIISHVHPIQGDENRTDHWVLPFNPPPPSPTPLHPHPHTQPRWASQRGGRRDFHNGRSSPLINSLRERINSAMLLKPSRSVTNQKLVVTKVWNLNSTVCWLQPTYISFHRTFGEFPLRTSKNMNIGFMHILQYTTAPLKSKWPQTNEKQ